MFKAPRDVTFRCSCGSVQGTLRGVSTSTGSHIACFCADCRAAEVFAGQPDPAPEPVTYFQTTPDRVRFDAGFDKLAVFSFGPKNLLRWQASCCGSPLFNTLRNPKIAFASIRTNTLDDQTAMGPVRATAFIPNPAGTPKHKGMGRIVWALFSRIAAARITGRWKQTPFFDPETLAPVREVQVVDKDVRAEIKASLS